MIIQILQELPIISIIFDENATATDLLQLVVCIALFWTVFFFFFGMAVRPLVKGKAWLAAAGSRDYDRGGKELYEALGCPVSREEFIERFEDQWPWMQGVLTQHMLGGFLCVPAIFGIGDKNIQASLACLSVLSEMGWEVSDMVGWIYTRWFTPGGKIKVPLGIVILLGLHHSLTITLGLPMVLHYRDNHYLHWLTFDLQFAGAVGLFVTEYTKLLDVSKPKELRQFQALSGFALVVIVITRAFHWVYLCSQLIMTWYQEKAWTFFVVGTLCSLSFSVFNWVFCIEPFYKRFVKFMKMSQEYTSLPAETDAKTRRASLVSLQEAAGNVMISQDDMNAELAELLLQLQQTSRTANKSGRRDTLPPSMFGSRSGRPRRRSSNVLLRSSMGNLSVALNQLHLAGGVKDD